MSSVYDVAKAGFMGVPTEISNTIDLSNDTLRMALFDNEGGDPYTFDATHDYVSSVFDGGTTGLEFSGTGYSRQTLAGVSISTDDTDNEGVFDHNDVTFTSLDGATIAAALSHVRIGADDTTPGDDPILAHLTSADFPLPTNGGDVTLNIDTEGEINIT